MDYPTRHNNHILENISKNALLSALPQDWVVNEFRVDYGTDFNCEIAKDNKVIGTNFSIQLKAKETESDNDYIVVKGLKRSTINRWAQKLEPIMIVAYIKNEQQLFWCWVEDKTFDLANGNETYQVKIPRVNSFNTINWVDIHSYVDQLFKWRHRINDIPENTDIETEAWKHFFNKNYDKALTLFKDLLKRDNASSSLHQAASVCEYELFRYKEALISINKSLELKNSVIATLNKASILTEWGKEKDDKEMLSLAISLYQEVLKTNRECSILYNYGNCLMHLKDFIEASRIFSESIEINPNKAEVWNSLGQCKNELKQPQLALQCFDKALSINPDLSQAIFNKGQTIFRVFGHVRLGLNIMLESVEADPDNRHELEFTYVYFWIAEAYLTLRDMDNANMYNSKGLNLNPTDAFFIQQKDRIKNNQPIFQSKD